MRVQLLYIDACPSWRQADELLHVALRSVGAEVEVEHVLVQTVEQAEASDFHGSPTILVDGLDPFPHAAGAAGLSCRLYPTPPGLAGSPTVTQLVEALTRS
ncbi:thioredoxin family protein [Isoptericola sp. b490]|uniref:DF family (seleno)protein n=1 Tax=Actinotalea lenta TaxID=3064654 RepID=UPI002712A3E8|nr:thioredoxin family protein [Isoptericola sp. b490]MDO8120315.1 thioredoxin family protein [Isoptericola sp. b490]